MKLINRKRYKGRIKLPCVEIGEMFEISACEATPEYRYVGGVGRLREGSDISKSSNDRSEPMTLSSVPVSSSSCIKSTNSSRLHGLSPREISIFLFTAGLSSPPEEIVAFGLGPSEFLSTKMSVPSFLAFKRVPDTVTFISGRGLEEELAATSFGLFFCF